MVPRIHRAPSPAHTFLPISALCFICDRHIPIGTRAGSSHDPAWAVVKFADTRMVIGRTSGVIIGVEIHVAANPPSDAAGRNMVPRIHRAPSPAHTFLPISALCFICDRHIPVGTRAGSSHDPAWAVLCLQQSTFS